MEKITAENYRAVLLERGVLPEGFNCGCLPLEFVPRELGGGPAMRMNLSLMLCDGPVYASAGVYTRNVFPGAPVRLCRERLASGPVRGILVNNKIANVCVSTGISDAEAVLAAAEDALGCGRGGLLSSSTGVIGWRLPVEEMKPAASALVRQVLSGGSTDMLPFAEGIMTTDSFPKIRGRKAGAGHITATVKGAGMIEPNMATMLCFIVTDLAVDGDFLQQCLSEAADLSFNRISVDGDQSTSDMVIALSSGRKPCGDKAEFRSALLSICAELAEDIVRNGEGTSHVMRISVKGASCEAEARMIGKAVANSPLVKTAVAGNDPNVGRIVAAVGDCCGNSGVNADVSRLSISLGGEIVFSGGAFLLDPEKERRLRAYLEENALPEESAGYPVHSGRVEIVVDLGLGSGESAVLGSDLTHGYVTENADYRS